MKIVLNASDDKKQDYINISQEVFNKFPDKNEYYEKHDNSKIIFNNLFFSEETKVNDCIRYLNNPFEKMTNKNVWNNSSKVISKDSKFPKKNIVLILESPHKDEYTDKFEPPYSHTLLP